jgi:hypothetical protein
LSGELSRIEIADVSISVRADTRGNLGSFSGLDLFSGLRGL